MEDVECGGGRSPKGNNISFHTFSYTSCLEGTFILYAKMRLSLITQLVVE